MAQAGYTPIQLYFSTTAAAVPTAGNLASGELAINITDGKLYYKNNSGTVTLLAGSTGSGPAGGSNTQVQYNSSGILAGSSNMTFDGTSLTLGGNPTLSAGTANGVAYLNGSKVVTSGSALVFDGSKLTVNSNSTTTAGFFQVNDATTTQANSFGSVVRNSNDGNGRYSLGAFTLQNASGLSQYAYIGAQSITGASNYTPDMVFGLSTGASTYAEQMRLTSTGLGIGTSSPAQKLHVENNANSSTWIKVANTNTGSGAAAGVLFTNNGGDLGAISLLSSANSPSNSLFLRSLSTNSLTLGTNNTVNATLDSSGNLGLGVTPSGNSLFEAISAGAQKNIIQAWYGSSNNLPFAIATDNANGHAYLGWNTKQGASSTQTYLVNNSANKLEVSSGQFRFYNAASGTAGNAITFTQAMTLDASGRLGIGITNPSSVLVLNTASGENTTTYALAGSAKAYVGVAAGSGQIIDGSAANDFCVRSGSNILFSAGGQYEKARIDSSGNFGLGTTSPAFKLDVFQTGSVNIVNVKGDASDGSALARFWQAADSGDNGFMGFLTQSAGTGTTRGSITYNRGAGLVAYNVTSDYRAKDINGPVTNSGALIDSVPVYMGKMKGATQERPMFIAHETPAYAHTGEKDAVDADGNPVYQQMDASALIPVMWAEIQSLRQRVAQLESN